jgi:urease subunit alpha
MMMVCHHLNPGIPEDVAFGESRIMGETIAAEEVLHDIGGLSMYSLDSQAMGRVGEVTRRAWQTADKMKKMSGRLKEEKGDNDNVRVKRYLAKLTMNPAITHGISDNVGSLQAGKMADIVVWTPQFFGVKPKLIIKGGFISYSLMGDPNALIPTPEPVYYRPMFGALDCAMYSTSGTFTSKLAIKNSLAKKLGIMKKLLPLKNCRKTGERDMILNNLTPTINIDPETYIVIENGKVATTKPANKLLLSRLYNLF